MKEIERYCRYCGKPLDKSAKKHTDNMCSNCRQKYRLVRDLCAICKQIKMECVR